MGDDESRIDGKVFWKRALSMYERWRTGREGEGVWKGSDAACVVTGKPGEVMQLSDLLVQHLFDGVLMTNTLMCVCDAKLVFLASKSKLKHLKPLAAQAPGDCGVELVTVELPKKEHEEALSQVVALLKQSHQGSKLCTISQDSPIGEFASKEWPDHVEKAGLVTQDCSAGIEDVLMIDANHRASIQLFRACSELACKGMKRFTKMLTKVFEDDEEASQQKLADDLETKLKGMAEKEEEARVAFRPSVMSGGKYSLDFGAKSATSALQGDVMICQLGFHFESVHCAVGRTFFVDGTNEQKKAYKLLSKAHKRLVQSLKPGSTLGDVYDKVAAYVKEQDAALESSLAPCLGYGTGGKLQFKSFAIQSGSSQVVSEGMAFLLQTAFLGVEETKKKKKTLADGKYSCVITDTVVVMASGGENLTAKSGSDEEDVFYDLEDSDEDGSDDEDEDEEDEDEDKNMAQALQQQEGRSGRRVTRASTKTPEQLAKEAEAANMMAKMAEQQKKLMEKKARRAIRAFEKGGADGDDEDDESAAEETEELLDVYNRGAKDYPRDMVRNQVYCDREKEAVLVPMGGFHVPFHVSIIKSVTKIDEERATLLRLAFYFPTSGLSFAKDVPKSMRNVMTQLPDLNYIKELTLRCRDPRNLNKQFRVIKEMQKRVRQRQRIKEEEADLVQQVDLKLQQDRRKLVELKDVSMKPSLRKGRSQGFLQAHCNGFRFRTMQRETFDVIYSNVKHFILQECKQEHNVIIHLHLKNPLIVGKVKTHDIQFYTEVIEASSALDGRRRSGADPDEEREEERERIYRRRVNKTFKNFCQQVIGVVKDNDETLGMENDVDMPYRKLQFNGVPNKEMVAIMPTVHALVNLTESPFFVVTLEDIEHVHFERVSASTKSFDMVIILKKQLKPNNGLPQRVTQIPLDKLETVQQWLHDLGNITFTQGTSSINWKTIMENVWEQIELGIFWTDKDIDGEKGPVGWNFLSMEEEEESGDEVSEESSAYEDQDESSEEESSEEESLADSDEDEIETASSEDDGADWDELEKQAAADDKRKNRRDEEYDQAEQKSKKRRKH